MAADGKDRCFLIDPELLVPDDGQASNPLFWKRFEQALSFTNYCALGEMSKMLFDDFISEAYTRGARAMTQGIIQDKDFWRLIGLAMQMEERRSGPVVNSITLSESEYEPHLGSKESRAAVEFDISVSNPPLVVVDSNTWPGFDDNPCKLFGTVILFDVKEGTKECARTRMKNSLSYASIENKAAEAFPNLKFCDGAWDWCSYFESNEQQFAPILYDYLLGLDDHALQVWQLTQVGDEREDRMDSYHVDCGPEKFETMQIKARKDERTFKYDGDPIEMKWHLKFVHDAGRIYFKVADNYSCVYIGGNTKHFETE